MAAWHTDSACCSRAQLVCEQVINTGFFPRSLVHVGNGQLAIWLNFL